MSGVFGRGTAIDVPTTVVTKGEFIDYLQVRGEVKAVRSVPLTVPTTGGGDLQILELAKNGMNIKKGDVVVRFDPMSVQRTLNDRRSEFKQAEEEIGKTRAQFRIQEQQTQTDLIEGALRRPAGGARHGAARISAANGARAEDAGARPTRRPGWPRPSGS